MKHALPRHKKVVKLMIEVSVSIKSFAPRRKQILLQICFSRPVTDEVYKCKQNELYSLLQAVTKNCQQMLPQR